MQRRSFLTIVGVTGGTGIGGYLTMRAINGPAETGERSTGATATDGPDGQTPAVTSGGVLHIPSGTVHVADSRAQPYRELRWEPQGSLVIEPGASLAFADTLEP